MVMASVHGHGFSLNRIETCNICAAVTLTKGGQIKPEGVVRQVHNK